MAGFGFIIHPLDTSYVQRVIPLARFLPTPFINVMLTYLSPRVVAKFTVRGSEGVFVGCPLTTEQMQTLPKKQVIDCIIRSCCVAKEHGADIVGLGAFTAIVTDQGMAIKDKVPVALTSGRAYTVWAVMEQIRPYLQLHKVIAVVGAHGAIGDAVLRLSAHYPIMEVSHHNVDSMYDADIIVLCTSHPGLLVNPSLLKPGTVVCDAAKPFNMPRNHKRKDIIIIGGGQIELPHSVEFPLDFDCGPNRVYACMAEPMLLAISGCIENFCLGNKISLNKIKEIGNISNQHGFNVVSPSECSK